MQVSCGGINQYHFFTINISIYFIKGKDIIVYICTHKQLPVVLVGDHIYRQLIENPLLCSSTQGQKQQEDSKEFNSGFDNISV